jgi:hypothetical protein
MELPSALYTFWVGGMLVLLASQVPGDVIFAHLTFALNDVIFCLHPPGKEDRVKPWSSFQL